MFSTVHFFQFLQNAQLEDACSINDDDFNEIF